MKTRFNWLFAASIAVVFVLGGTIASFAQEDRFFGGNGITVFVDKNFKGNTQTFQNDVPDLSSYGLDRKISSFRAGNNEEWQICDGKRYGGRCASVSGEEYDLSINGWNDRIRSFRRTSGSGGGGQTSTPPSWAQGTFYGTAPDGSQIMLTIARNGQVTANINGSMSYGTYYRGDININGAQSNVSQSGNGIRTRRNDNGETINYSRNSWGGGWNGNGNAPSWAVGTWRWVQGNNRTMNIASNGRVTLYIDGATSYGTIYNDRLVINGNTSNVTRTGNGFRTYNQTTGEVSDYVLTGGNNGGGWNGNGNTSKPPGWAQGTWYWTNGPDRRMVIDKNGRVTLFTGGTTSYGTYYDGVITLNGEQSPVTRNGNNITTYNQSSGETSNYSKNNNGWNGGGSSNTPSWIVGRFVWANGSGRTFLIESNGQVTLYLGSTTQVGTYSNGIINLGGNTSTVTEIRNGFRTVNQQTGEVSDYRRQ